MNSKTEFRKAPADEKSMVKRLHWTDMGMCLDVAPDNRPLYVTASDYDAAQARISKLDAVIGTAYARITELEDALLAIEPHLPKSTAKNGGPDSYAAHVLATDKVRDALKGCSHPSAVK